MVDDSQRREIQLVAKVTFAVLLVPAFVFPLVTWEAAAGYWESLPPFPTTVSLICIVGLVGALASWISPSLFHPFLKVYFLLAAVLLALVGVKMAMDLIPQCSLGIELLLVLFVTAVPFSLAGLHWWALRRLRRATRSARTPPA